jgi:hypothetical protein
MAFASKPNDRYYRLAHADSASGLQHKVNELIDEGFIPQGRAFIISNNEGLHTEYYQTMVARDLNQMVPKSAQN